MRRTYHVRQAYESVKERHVLAASMHDRQAFTAIAHHVGRSDLSEQGWIIWEHICTYYDADPGAKSVDGSILADSITRSVAADKHKAMFVNLVKALDEFDASNANVVADLLATKRDMVGKQLAAAILAGESTGALLDKYDALLIQETLEDEEEEDARIGLSVEDLVATGFNSDNLIDIYPLSLNERLDGGVKPGHHIVVFARPEMGKTMLMIEMMYGFARQDLTTLYIGNEDPLDDINMRLVNRMSGMTKIEVLHQPRMADKIARENGYENVILKSLTPGTPREITALLTKFNPHVLVLDQLRNLNMSQDNRVLQLEEAATMARQWAKRYSCVVVSVTQAGDSAAGKAVLDMGDVDYSNTGIPSQADVMVGIGAGAEQIANGELVLSLPKNKISGRHEYFPVGMDPQLSKIYPI